MTARSTGKSRVVSSVFCRVHSSETRQFSRHVEPRRVSPNMSMNNRHSSVRLLC